jgi:hypothetical protein
LQAQYEERSEQVQKEKSEIKQSWLGFMRAVRANLVKEENNAKEEL